MWRYVINRMRRIAEARLCALLTARPGERFRGAVECRGLIYIITSDRILRYDPGREQFQVECHTS